MKVWILLYALNGQADPIRVFETESACLTAMVNRVNHEGMEGQKFSCEPKQVEPEQS